MMYSILIEHTDDDLLWHTTFTTKARSIQHAIKKASRIVPFSHRINVLPESDAEWSVEDLKGDKLMTGGVFSVALPEHNNGKWCDRRPMFKDGIYLGESDLSFHEEDMIAYRIRSLIGRIGS